MVLGLRACRREFTRDRSRAYPDGSTEIRQTRDDAKARSLVLTMVCYVISAPCTTASAELLMPDA